MVLGRNSRSSLPRQDLESFSVVEQNQNSNKLPKRSVGIPHVFSKSNCYLTLFLNITESKTQAKAKILVIDFSAPTESDYSALANTCNGLDIGILGMHLQTLWI